MTKPPFKVHRNPTHDSKELVLRVAQISNGYIVKGGSVPIYRETLEEVREVIDQALAHFAGAP